MLRRLFHLRCFRVHRRRLQVFALIPIENTYVLVHHSDCSRCSMTPINEEVKGDLLSWLWVLTIHPREREKGSVNASGILHDRGSLLRFRRILYRLSIRPSADSPPHILDIGSQNRNKKFALVIEFALYDVHCINASVWYCQRSNSSNSL